MKKGSKKSKSEIILAKLKPYKKKIITALIVIASVWLIIFLEFHVLFITGLSRSKMEKMYDIKVTDDISLKRYDKELVFREGYRRHLYVGGIEDIKKFLDKNCGGKRAQYLLLSNSGALVYEYRSKAGKKIEIHFTEKKGKYRAEFILYP